MGSLRETLPPLLREGRLPAGAAAAGWADSLAASLAADQAPVTLALFGHFLFMMHLFRVVMGPLPRGQYLLSFLTGAVGSFGGGILTALLLQDPARAPLAMFADNRVMVLYAAAWYGWLHAPGRPLQRAYDAVPLLPLVCRAASSYLRSLLIVARVDLAASKYPLVVAAHLICGTLAGSGGGFMSSLIMRSAGLSARPPDIVVPGFGFKSAFVAALLYAGLAHWTALLSPAEGKLALVTLLVGHGVASDLAKRPLDFSAYPFEVFHRLSGIPPAVGIAAPAPAAATPRKKTTPAAKPTTPGPDYAATPRRSGRVRKKKEM